MLTGYMRASATGGSRELELQRDALLAAGVHPTRLHEDCASSKYDDRPELETCLNSLCDGDTLVAWKLNRLGRNLHHLVDLVHELTGRGVGLRILVGDGAVIDTTTSNGRLMFGVFAALAEFERDLIVERTRVGLAAARACGRRVGRPYKMTLAKLRRAQSAMSRRETNVGELYIELGVTRQTLYRHVDPKGRLRPDGEKLLYDRPTEEGQQGSQSDMQGAKAGARHA